MNEDLMNSTDLMCWIILKWTTRRYTHSEMKDVRIACYEYQLLCMKLQEWNINILQMLNDNRYRPKINNKKNIQEYVEWTIKHYLDYNL
jgi:hypothetical protein